MSNQKANYKKGKLNLERIKKLEPLPEWSWNAFEDKWNEGFNYLKIYSEEHHDLKVQRGFKYGGFNLGTWVSTQRMNKNKLDLVRIQKLESLPNWVWHTKGDI